MDARPAADAAHDTALLDGLRRLGDVASSAHAAVVVAVAVVLWLAIALLAGRPSWMLTALQTAAAGMTLVMVFVIQHAQRRTEAAIHLKLDALIRASDADDELTEIEQRGHEELEHRRQDLHPAGDA
jgi:low affinity Fe/Cu permease